MVQEEIYLLIISGIVTFLIFSVSLGFLLLMFQKRRDTYRKEMSNIRVEIKEQTLKNISWEIHDNVGQILSTINLYSFQVYEESSEEAKPRIKEMQELIQIAILEVRSLSRALNSDYIKNVGLIKTTEMELERFTRLKFLKPHFNVTGKVFVLPDDDCVVLLRIVQEFLSNTIKHAKATELWVDFEFNKNKLKIRLQDNGIGFNQDEVKGNGLINMKNRAKLLGAFLKLETEKGKGTLLEIIYKLKTPENV